LPGIVESRKPAADENTLVTGAVHPMGTSRAARLCFCLVAVLPLAGCVGMVMHAVKYLRKAPSARTGGVAVPDGEPPLAKVRAELQAAVAQGAPGITAIVMRGGDPVFRLDVGPIARDAQLPVASASKWMAAALVMTVVDEGRLSLDAPISRYLPAFHGRAGTVTLRELLAQTSGEGSLKQGVDIRQDARITLEASAAEIARRPLDDPPGTVFKYGGPGFQVAGAAVEAVTGKRWAQLFDERIARPAGMRHTYWIHLPTRGATPAQTHNPLLQGGVVTTAEDYMRFLTLLAQGGRIGNRRVLSQQAVETMETVQTLGKPMSYVPSGARGGARPESAQYALGNWCESWDAAGRCRLVSSPGAFGTFPWIDRGSGLYGIFFTRDRLPRVIGHFAKARRAILAAYAPHPATHAGN
jgi:CubicO group peptidase (beta-lactamase class C family)